MNFIAEILEKHLKEEPNHPFIYDDKFFDGIAYKEIYDLSGKVYAYLKNKGIGKEGFVQINMPRGAEIIIAMLGVWRAGAAFVANESTDPIERVKYIYNDCNCKIQINQDTWDDILRMESLHGYEDVDVHDASYVVYTSGTTGNPKGIIHEYGNLKECCDSEHHNGKRFFAEDESFAVLSSFSFVAVEMLLLFLVNKKKSKFYIVPNSIKKDSKKLLLYLKEKNNTAIFVPPTYIKAIGEKNLSFLKLIIISAEQANRIIPIEGVPIFNVYSCSESGHFVGVFEIDKLYDICPIGTIQFDKKVYLLDDFDNEVTDGDVGEICFDNPYVRGYINLPEENKRAFKNNIYHTNDLAKKLPTGDYVVIGRKSDMIKISGNRVEPAEVEAVVRKILNIDWCGVRGFEEYGNECLAAYYMADIKVDINELRDKLSKELPYYMIPTYFIRIDEIPVNRNGKFDRKLLPVPKIKVENIELPKTDFEKKVFDIVSNELKTKDFGVTTNLFSIGLTSIKAIRISVVIDNETNYSIKVNDILAKPYIREWINFVNKEVDTIEVLQPVNTYPLTENQLGVYIDWERNKNSLQYNLPMAFNLKSINPNKLHDALKKVIEAHQYFKVHLIENELGKIVQERRDNESLDIIFRKLDKEPDDDFFQNRVRPFNLLNNDLSRFEIYYTDNNTYLFFDIHHIIFDYTSANIVLYELFKYYDEKGCTKEKVSAYDYSLFYNDWLQSEKYKKAEKYFDKLISDTHPFMYPTVNIGAKLTGRMETYIGQMEKQNIKEYCSKLGITENVFFATIITQVFHRISREDSIQIATISNGRSIEQLSNTIGMFVQTLPLISKNSKGNIEDVLRSMQEQIINTINYDKFPYTKLAEKYNVNPYVLYAYQGDVIDRDNISKFRQMNLLLDTVKTPLSIDVNTDNDKYFLSFEYDKVLYTKEKIAKLSFAIINFANNLIKKKKNEGIETVSLISENDEKEIVTLGTGEKLDYDKTKAFVDLFIEQVKTNPDAVAVVDFKSKITYGELDRQSNLLAKILLEKNIKPNDFVAVKLPRIKEFVISVIGIWKVGAAYVPIDTEYPNDRIDYMIDDSEAKVVIDEEFLSNIDFNGTTNQSTKKEIESINNTTPENLAYMIYTSGSTGKPKGVMVSQFNLRTFLAFYVLEMNIKKNDNIAVHASFSFDASIEMYSSLVTGATLHILSSDLRCDIKGMHEYFEKNNIKGLEMIPSVASEFMDYGNSTLSYISMGGEVAKKINKTSTNIYNAYGPTEFTDISNVWLMNDVEDNSLIPIGRPIYNSISAVVDKFGNLLPRGINGELALIGPQLSRGYWKNIELTNEKFIDCPFIKNEKMYRTGDIVRWNEKGELLFIGRTDNQVKLRGYRIELGEIELTLSKIHGPSMTEIKSCVVEVKTINNIQHLIAYYVAENEISTEYLKKELSKTLTDYMIPDMFMWLDKMPLTPNGKVNREALPIPELKADEIVLPETKFEKAIFDIVSKELKTKEFGVTTNLISMGLTSIKAIRLSALIKKETNNTIKTGDILSKPYIREWINLVDKNNDEIKINLPRKTYPLTANQLNVYYTLEKDKDRTPYNTATVFKISNVDYKKILDVLNNIIRSHPIFKTHIVRDEFGNLLQERRDNEELSIKVIKLDIEPDKEFFQKRVKPFNILNDDLSRFEIYYTDKNVYLFIDILHIIFDGTSFNLLLSEIYEGYKGNTLSVEKFTAFDYSLYYNEWLKSDSYKKASKYFADLVAGTKSFMYPYKNTNNIATGKEVFIKKQISRKGIKEYCSKLGITENAFFATILTQVFRKNSGEDNIQITTISSGRNIEQFSDTYGMFIHMVPLVSKNSKGNIAEIMKLVQEQIISTINYDKYPYIELVKKYNVETNVLYTYQGDILDNDNTFDNLEITEPAVDAIAPLSIDIFSKENNFDLLFYYDYGLYTKEEIEKLSTDVLNLATKIYCNERCEML